MILTKYAESKFNKSLNMSSILLPTIIQKIYEYYLDQNNIIPYELINKKIIEPSPLYDDITNTNKKISRYLETIIEYTPIWMQDSVSLPQLNVKNGYKFIYQMIKLLK